MCSDTSTLLALFRLAWISDSALPTGAFSFSLGLEGAVESGLVSDLSSLEEYTIGALYGAAECDGVAMLEAYRAIADGDHTRVKDADAHLLSFKAGEEAREMTLRMGRRLIELIHSICPTPLTEEFYGEVVEGTIAGCYPTAQALAGYALGIGERALYAAHLYGVANTILSAALRLMRLSHYDTQAIIYRLAPLCERLYDLYGSRTMEEMTSFIPTLELAASLHERGIGRLFMN